MIYFVLAVGMVVSGFIGWMVGSISTVKQISMKFTMAAALEKLGDIEGRDKIHRRIAELFKIADKI